MVLSPQNALTCQPPRLPSTPNKTISRLLLLCNASRSVLRFAWAIAFAFVLMAATCLPATAQQYAAPTSPEFAASAASVPNQINQIRLNANLHALTADPLLQHAAQLHALDMITYGNWGHIGTDGSRVKDRVARSGYVVDGWTSENWVSAIDAMDAMRWWMNSPVHKSNILSTHWREFGIGSVVDPNSGRTIYVTVFATGQHTTNPTQNNQAGNTWVENNSPTGQSAPPVVHAAPSANPLGQLNNGANRPTTRATTHSTIRAGDTLFGLADQLDVPWTDLASLNGWSEATILQIGDQFIIPDPLANYPNNAVANNNQFLAELATEAYLIQPGDTLISIATDFQSEWQVLAHINNLRNADMLQIGQNLLVPARPNSQGVATEQGDADVQEATVKQNPRFIPLSHVVETGDTVISIAAQYGIDWQTLLQINSLTDSSILQIGQKIQISTITN